MSKSFNTSQYIVKSMEEYRTTIIFDKDMRRKIKLYQVDNDESMKEIIYKSLNQFFDKEVKKDRKK